MDSPSPEMLRLAMEYRGLTQSQLGEAAGVSQSYLSKILKEALPFPEDRVTAFADALGFPEGFFYKPAPERGDAVTCFYHRKRQSLPVGQLKRIQAEARIAGMATAELLEDVEIQASNGFLRLDLEDFDSPEHVAQEVRRAWRLPRGPLRNIVRVIEAAGGIVIKRVFGTRKLDAISHWTSDGAPLFIINADSPTDRVRFTLAHEIAHLVMHTLLTPDPEREADRFAAEFLMPAQDIAPDLAAGELTLQRFAQLKSYWRTSMAALIRRAYTLFVISQRQYERLIQRLRMRYGLTEPNPLAPEEPTIIADALAVHRDEHGLTIADLARHCRLLEADFRDLFIPHGNLRLVMT